MKKILALILAGFTTMSAFAFVGCKRTHEEFCSHAVCDGFDVQDAGCLSTGRGYYAAYSVEKKEFDIDDVKLTFYYGDENGGGLSGYDSSTDQEYQLSVYFISNDEAFYKKYDEEERKDYIRKKEEGIYKDIDHVVYIHKIFQDTRFYSEEYMVKVDDFGRIEFAHQEDILIPREMFFEKEGMIGLCFSESWIRQNDIRDWGSFGVYFRYTLNGEKVTISKY